MALSEKDLLEALKAEGGALDDLVTLAVDAVLDLPVDHLVEVEWIVRAVDAALSEGVTSEVIDRYLKPAAARERTRARQTAEPVSAAVPGEMVPEMAALLQRPLPINPEIIQDLVDQKAVRSMLGAVVQEALLGFLQRSKLPGLSGAAGLVGAFGKRAGKGLLGAAGKGLEKGMEQRVREFLDQSMARLTGKIVELASSDGGLKLQGAMRADLFDKALRREVSFFYEELAKMPTDEIWALVPRLLAHNLAREEVREALRGELRAGLEREAGKSMRALLAELGVEDAVRDLALERATPVAHAVVRTEAFGAWLEALLEGSGS